MIDIHTHVLPGLDDGAETVAEAKEMLRHAAAAGTTDIVATPHANLHYGFDPKRARAVLTELTAAAGPGMPRIHLGCEVHLTYDNVVACLGSPHDYTLAGGRYLLLELPEDKVPRNAAEIINDFIAAGLRPVIAHPERTACLGGNSDRLRPFAELGCLFQLTAASFAGRHGKRAERASRAFVQDGFAHFVASDAHDSVQRPAVLTQAFEILRGDFGESCARMLCRENPLAAIENRELPAAPVPPSREVRARKWWSFRRSSPASL